MGDERVRSALPATSHWEIGARAATTQYASFKHQYSFAVLNLPIVPAPKLNENQTNEVLTSHGFSARLGRSAARNDAQRHVGTRQLSLWLTSGCRVRGCSQMHISWRWRVRSAARVTAWSACSSRYLFAQNDTDFACIAIRSGSLIGPPVLV